LKSEIYPILVASARQNIGVNSFLDYVTNYFPKAIDITIAPKTRVKPMAIIPTIIIPIKINIAIKDINGITTNNITNNATTEYQ